MFDWNTTRVEALLADINVTLTRLVDLWDEPKVQPAPEPVPAPEPEPEPEPVPVAKPNFVLPKRDAFDEIDAAALLRIRRRNMSFEDVVLRFVGTAGGSNTFSAQSLVKKFRYLTPREVVATLYALRAENKLCCKAGTRYGEERVLFGIRAHVLGKDRISLGLVRRILTEQFPRDAR